jgi:hypothetical protein
VPRGNPVNGVGIVRYPDAVPGQLVTESYRPGASGRWRRGQCSDALLQLLRPANQWLPDPRPLCAVERREDLAAAGVEDGEAIAVPFFRHAGIRRSGGDRLRHPKPDRVQRADAGNGQAEAGAEPARSGDADPQPGERAGTESDPQQANLLPASCGAGATLDLPEQGGRVPGIPRDGGPQQRLV